MNAISKSMLSILIFVFISGQARAHCDTIGGPVVATAKAALEPDVQHF